MGRESFAVLTSVVGMVGQTWGAAGHVAPWFSSVASVPSPPQSSDTEIASIDQQEEQVKRKRATVGAEHAFKEQGRYLYLLREFVLLSQPFVSLFFLFYLHPTQNK